MATQRRKARGQLAAVDQAEYSLSMLAGRALFVHSVCCPHPLVQRLSVRWAIVLVSGAFAVVLGACGEDTVREPPNTAIEVAKPKVILAGIQEGDLLTGTVSIQAEVKNASDVRGVQFYVGDVRVDTVDLKPYETTVNTAAYADGPTTIAAVAAVGRSGSYRAEVKVSLDNTTPEISLTDPSPSDPIYYCGGDITFKFKATDASDIGSVEVNGNGVAMQVSGPPYEAKFNLDQLYMSPKDLKDKPLDLQVRIKATDKLFLSTTKDYWFQLRSRLAWSFETLGEVWATPAFGKDGTVYIGSLGGDFYAIDPAGKELWSSKPGPDKKSISYGAMVESTSGADRVWVSAGDTIRVFDTKGGDALPSHTMPSENAGTSPVLGEKAVYVGSFSGDLEALDVSKNTVLWSTSISGAIQSTPVVLDGEVVVFGGAEDLTIHAIDGEASTHKELWNLQTTAPIMSSAARTKDGDVLIGSDDGYLYRLNRYGSKKGSFEARGWIWGAAAEASNGMIYVASSYRRLYGLKSDMEQAWEATLSGFLYSTPAVARDGTVLVAATDGTVHAYASSGTEQWACATGEKAVNGSVALSPDESLVVVGNLDRSVYVLYSGIVSCPPPEMVEVAGARVMKYEASRPDATDKAEGVRTNRVCSRSGVRPWTYVGWAEARAACQSVGLDLCPGTVWEAACRGSGGADFPYGASYDQTKCNGGSSAVVPTGTRSTCVSESEAVDASGNVREWTLDPSGANYITRGGGFRDQGDNLRCSNVEAASHALSPSTRDKDLGFRCCETP